MSDITFNEISSTVIKNSIDIVTTSGRNDIGVESGKYVADPQATALLSNHPNFIAQSSNGRAFRALASGGIVSAELGGAAGDGLGDDRPAIAATHAYIADIGAKAIGFNSSSYRLAPVPNSETDYGQGPQPCYVVPVDAGAIDGRGAEFIITSGRGMVCGWWYAGGIVDLDIAANIAAGSKTVELEPGLASQLSVGESIIWMLGDVPFDQQETYNWGIAQAIGIANDVVTLDKQIPESFTVTPGLTNRHVRKGKFARDLAIRNVRLTSENGQVGIAIYGGERLIFDNVGSRDLSAATIGLHYVDGATLSDCWTDGTRITQASSGAAFSFAECRNIQLLRPSASHARTLVRAEAGSEVQGSGAHFECNLRDSNGNSLSNQVKIFSATGRSRISMHDTTITGDGGYFLSVQSNGNPAEDGEVYFSGRTKLVHPTDPYQLPISRMSGVLDMTIAGQSEVYNLDRLRLYRRRFNLRNGQYLQALGPMGILAKARVYVTPGVTIGAGQQLNAFTVGRLGNNGSNVAQGALGGLQAGVDVQLNVSGGSVAGIQWTNRLDPLLITVATPFGEGLDNESEFVEIEAWMAEPEDTDRPVSEANWRGEGSEREVREAKFPGVDLPSIDTGASFSQDFAVPDIAAGDFIVGVAVSTGLSGLVIQSAEAINGSARLVFHNPTDVAIDKGPADLFVSYSKSSLGA